MKFDYKETTNDLETRINIHTLYGKNNIDEWMLEKLPLKDGMKLLDIGCGAGKQCFLFNDYLKTDCDITGGDVSDELLAQARERAVEKGADIEFIHLSFDEAFPFEDNQFDLITCCFAIYYAEDMPFTINQMHRLLKPGGHIFITGPLPANKKMFYDIIHEATGKKIPPMPGSSRFDSEILTTVKDIFAKTDMLVFENPLVFADSPQPFIDYTKASVSEDRKLWNTLFDENDSFTDVMNNIERVSKEWYLRDGQLVMTKVVGGIFAQK